MLTLLHIRHCPPHHLQIHLLSGVLFFFLVPALLEEPVPRWLCPERCSNPVTRLLGTLAVAWARISPPPNNATLKPICATVFPFHAAVPFDYFFPGSKCLALESQVHKRSKLVLLKLTWKVMLKHCCEGWMAGSHWTAFMWWAIVLFHMHWAW